VSVTSIIEFLPAILFFLAFKFASILICGALKVKVVRSTGADEVTLDAILSAKRESLDVQELTEILSERRLRIADAVGRKGMHILFFLVSLIIVQTMELGHDAAIHSGIAVGIVTMIFMLALYRSDSWLGQMIFRPYARVMDGKRARLNMLSAQVLGTAQATLLATLGYLGLFALGDETYAYAMMYAIYLPVALGDTMGEIVGAFWGKQKLRVLGIGDVNRKSVEGTAAVFLTTLIALLVVSIAVPSPEGYVGLAFLIAVVTTVTELVSPRSTDSFFIPVINAAVVTLWFTL
jgi:dolichol kinase